MPEPKYYTLVDRDVGVGDVITDHPFVAVDPRKLPVSDILDVPVSLDGFAVVLHGAARLARLAPQGEVTTEEEGGHCEYDADAWKVAGFEPLRGFLGPQADELVAVTVVTVDQRGQNFDKETKTATAYDEAIEAQDWSIGGPARMAELAAAEALHKAGADSYWWTEAWGSNSGTEILALAARDLIGTVPGWTWEAYLELTTPYRYAFGSGPHPEDPARDPEPAKW